MVNPTSGTADGKITAQVPALFQLFEVLDSSGGHSMLHAYKQDFSTSCSVQSEALRPSDIITLCCRMQRGFLQRFPIQDWDILGIQWGKSDSAGRLHSHVSDQTPCKMRAFTAQNSSSRRCRWEYEQKPPLNAMSRFDDTCSYMEIISADGRAGCWWFNGFQNKCSCKPPIASSGFIGFREEEVSFKELVQMHGFVTKTLNQKSIIVDADDLLADPGSSLTWYSFPSESNARMRALFGPNLHWMRGTKTSKWNLLLRMGVFTLDASNIKGIAPKFAWLRPV